MINAKDVALVDDGVVVNADELAVYGCDVVTAVDVTVEE